MLALTRLTDVLAVRARVDEAAGIGAGASRQRSRLRPGIARSWP